MLIGVQFQGLFLELYFIINPANLDLDQCPFPLSSLSSLSSLYPLSSLSPLSQFISRFIIKDN